MEHREAIEGLLKWWHRCFGIVRGARNANLYKLAAAFNSYGIPFSDALTVCLRFEDLSGPDPFTGREITATVESAYRRTEHGTKSWTPRRSTSASLPPVPQDRVQAFVQRHHLEHFVEAMDLDLDRARIIPGAKE
jgi:hypothetical protein